MSTESTWPATDLDIEVESITIHQGVLGLDPVVMYPDREHGAWYERGKGDAIGGLWMPMNTDGSPDWACLGTIEVLYADA